MFSLVLHRTDENLISRPGTNGYVSKLPAICPYGRAKASLLPKIFCLRKHVSSFADCFTGMISFFVVYLLLPYSCGETECGKEEGFFIDHIPVFPTYIDARKYKKERKCSSKAIFGGAFYYHLHGLLSVRKSLQKATLSAVRQSKWGEACLRTICGWAACKIFVWSPPRER
ncbi:hypothetical protein BHF69_01240 [Anaerostipes sp. 992a]|nr:hypothetical protein BHF69_01240 [Anaerostipes sp. 992a]